MKSKLSLIVLFFVAALQAQNLNIITSGGDIGTSGSNWSISGNTLNVAATGTANINPSVITNHLNTVGDLTINLPWHYLYTRNINIINSINYTGSTTRSLIINAANDLIISSGVSITSSNSTMNLVLRTNLSDGDPDWGRIQLDGVTINTHGGHFWAGGGAVNTAWNGLIVGNSYTRIWNDDVAALSLVGSSITTNGGDVYLAGRSHDSTDANGINYGVSIDNTSISSTSGNITIEGTVNGAYNNGIATRIHAITGSVSITSTSGAIIITGSGNDQTSNNGGYRNGTYIYGTSNTINTTISSTSGAISIQGDANFTSSAIDKVGLMIRGGVTIASQTGAIQMQGSNVLETTGQLCNSICFAANDEANSIRIGYDGINAYSGNILIEGNSIYQLYTYSGAGSIAIQSTGTLTIQPKDSAFTYLRAGDSGTLSFDDDWNFGTTLSGLTIGKLGNTKALTLSNAISVAGPITIDSGLITTGNNLTATLAGAAITLRSTNHIKSNAATTLTTQGGGSITCV